MMTTRRTVKTFEAKIYVGFRKAYRQEGYNPTEALETVRRICHDAVKVGWCVTIQPVEYIYTPTFTTGQPTPVNGEEGALIGVINYPRFPLNTEDLKERTLTLATRLMEQLHQEGVTVVFTDESVMVERVPTVN